MLSTDEFDMDHLSVSHRRTWIPITIAVMLLCIFVVAPVCFHLFFSFPTYPDPMVVLRPFTRRSQHLIAAIKRYEADRGSPPDSLRDLVPKYLAKVPSTGLDECPNYSYETFSPKDRRQTMLWYDLGSRNGAGFVGLWGNVEGDPEHAILTIAINGLDEVAEIRGDRLPADLGNAAFDSAQWRRTPINRTSMARDVKKRLSGKSRADVIEFLGPPNGAVATFDTPWQLEVHYTWRWLDPGNFLYWPTRNYPVEHWGHTTRVDDWIFLHF